MCVIFHLKPGQLLPFNMIENACWNNPHGYGIVLKENKRLQVLKELPANGNDPQEIQRILEDNKDIDRYTHLRFRTQGEISADNTQPFTVYHSSKRQIEFMHNGTLNTTYDKRLDHILEEAKITPAHSDSRKFAYGKLAPLLLKFKGEHGAADISDPFFYELIDKLWGYGSRGLLICNDLDHVTLGTWQEILIPGTEEKFLASNNDYFNVLKRGEVFEKRKKEREERERAERESRYSSGSAFNNGNNRAPFDQGGGKLSSVPFQKRFSISEEITELFEDVDMYSPEGLIALSALTIDEIDSFIKKSPKDFAMMFMLLGDMFKSTFAQLKELQDDKDKATKLIATLKSGNKSQGKQEEVVGPVVQESADA